MKEESSAVHPPVYEITLVCGDMAYLGVHFLGGFDCVTSFLGEDFGHGDRQCVADDSHENGVEEHLWEELQERHGRDREPGRGGMEVRGGCFVCL